MHLRCQLNRPGDDCDADGNGVFDGDDDVVLDDDCDADDDVVLDDDEFLMTLSLVSASTHCQDFPHYLKTIAIAS